MVDEDLKESMRQYEEATKKLISTGIAKLATEQRDQMYLEMYKALRDAAAQDEALPDEGLKVAPVAVQEGLVEQSYRYVPREEIVKLLYKKYVELMKSDDTVAKMLKDFKNIAMWREFIIIYEFRKESATEKVAKLAVDSRRRLPIIELVAECLKDKGFPVAFIRQYQTKAASAAAG